MAQEYPGSTSRRPLRAGLYSGLGWAAGGNPGAVSATVTNHESKVDDVASKCGSPRLLKFMLRLWPFNIPAISSAYTKHISTITPPSIAALPKPHSQQQPTHIQFFSRKALDPKFLPGNANFTFTLSITLILISSS